MAGSEDFPLSIRIPIAWWFKWSIGTQSILIFLTLWYWVVAVLYGAMEVKLYTEPELCDYARADDHRCMEGMKVSPDWIFFVWLVGWFIVLFYHRKLCALWKETQEIAGFEFPHKVEFSFFFEKKHKLQKLQK